MKIVEFIGNTSSGKTSAIKQLKCIPKEKIYGHFEYILKVLKMPFNRFTYLFILHPFLYIYFAISGSRFNCCHFFFKAVICIAKKGNHWPFVIKLKLINNLIRTLGSCCWIKVYTNKHKNDDIILIDEGLLQIINNIVVDFDKDIDVENLYSLLALLQSDVFFKTCLFTVPTDIALQRCLNRKDPAFGRKKLTNEQWCKYITNYYKSCASLQSLKKIDLLVVSTENGINADQILEFIN